MAIPSRYALIQPSEYLIKRMGNLCDQIERKLESGCDVTELLREWHQHARRECDSCEFTNYWRAASREQFIRDALNPPPTFVDDVTYDDVFSILESLVNAEIAESESAYYLHWLEVQFPNANMSDLVYWPDEWFGDASLFRDQSGAFKPESELTLHQILGYAMKASGRQLTDRPIDVSLPFPLPAKP
ncbi:MAG: hypothetical protein NXI04_14545 [Planctomycetaceae bacterium]|nr:hypothetical protein [Planctomycetaceae bacterium]